MRKIRVAQIGISREGHGAWIWESIKKQSDIFEIVGYALPENEREKFPEKMPLFDGYKELTVEEILADSSIEAVFIENEEIYITKYALMAAKAGKHLHMEKPGGQSLTEFEELIKSVKKNGKVFHTGYMYRYNPYVIELLADVKSGKLGDIISVEAQMNCDHSDVTRDWLEVFKGGMMFFLGCHLIDLVLQIKGDPVSITAFNKSFYGKSEDFSMAVFEYNDAVSFVKTTDTELGGFARRQLVVTGTKKTVVLNPFEMFKGGNTTLFTGRTEYSSHDWGDRGVYTESETFDRYDNMIASFGAMVRGEKKNEITPDYELKLFKTILKCCEVTE